MTSRCFHAEAEGRALRPRKGGGRRSRRPRRTGPRTCGEHGSRPARCGCRRDSLLLRGLRERCRRRISLEDAGFFAEREEGQPGGDRQSVGALARGARRGDGGDAQDDAGHGALSIPGLEGDAARPTEERGRVDGRGGDSSHIEPGKPRRGAPRLGEIGNRLGVSGRVIATATLHLRSSNQGVEPPLPEPPLPEPEEDWKGRPLPPPAG